MSIPVPHPVMMLPLIWRVHPGKPAEENSRCAIIERIALDSNPPVRYVAYVFGPPNTVHGVGCEAFESIVLYSDIACGIAAEMDDARCVRHGSGSDREAVDGNSKIGGNIHCRSSGRNRLGIHTKRAHRRRSPDDGSSRAVDRNKGQSVSQHIKALIVTSRPYLDHVAGRRCDNGSLYRRVAVGNHSGRRSGAPSEHTYHDNRRAQQTASLDKSLHNTFHLFSNFCRYSLNILASSCNGKSR